MYALWRTCQHYATPGAIPEGTASCLDTILNQAHRLPSTGKFGHFVAHGLPDRWVAIGFIKHGSIKYSKPEQLEKYDQCRYHGKKFSNAAYPPLTRADHPSRTVDLDDPTEYR